ncbi:hypothetical protein J6590_027837 [Homalodisca vitripennis]|nr:hypothetical protein J6590_027837 [Homalodisca vitripennis]
MSLYKFVKTSSSTREGRGVSPGRLFVEGRTQEDGVTSVEAVYTRRHLTSDYQGHAEESRHSARRPGGVKSVTTRVVRKTTTLTRGEERSVTESLMREGRQRIESVPLERSYDRRAIQAKRAKTRWSMKAVVLPPKMTRKRQVRRVAPVVPAREESGE